MSAASRIDYSQLSDSSYKAYQDDPKKPLLEPLSVFKDAVEQFIITNEQAYKWLDLFQIRNASLNVQEIARHKEIVARVFGLVETVGITSKDGTLVYISASKLRKYPYFSQTINSPVIGGKTSSATISWSCFETATLEVFKNYLETGSLRCDFSQLVAMYDIGRLIEDHVLIKKCHDAILMSSGKIDVDVISSVMAAMLASVCSDEGDYEEAVSLYAKAIALRPSDGASLIALGRIFAQQKRFTSAIAHLTKALKDGLYDPQIQFQIAQISLRQIHFFEVDAVRAIIVPLVNLKKTLFNRQLTKDLFSQSMKELKALIEKDEEMLYAFGGILDAMNVVSDPYTLIKKLEELFFVTRRKLIEEVLKRAEVSLRKQPETKAVLHLLGIVLFEQKEYREAAKKFETLTFKYRLFGDEEQDVLSYLGRANLQLGKTVDAPFLKRYLSLRIDPRQSYYYLVALVDENSVATDQSIVKKLEGIDAIDAQECLGRYYLRQGDFKKAQDFFEKVLARRQEADAVSFFYLGLIAKKMGDSQAASYFDKALFFEQKGFRELRAVQYATILRYAAKREQEFRCDAAFVKIAAVSVDEVRQEERKMVAEQLVRGAAYLPTKKRQYHVEACRYDASVVIAELERSFQNLTIEAEPQNKQMLFSQFVDEQIRLFKKKNCKEAFEFLLGHYRDELKMKGDLFVAARRKFPREHSIEERYCMFLCDAKLFGPARDIAVSLQPQACSKNFAGTLCTLAKWLIDAEDLDSAHELLQMAEKIDPDNNGILIEGVRLSLEIELNEELKVWLLDKKNPEFAEMLEARARRYVIAREYACARECAELANTLEQSTSRQLLLGAILLYEKQFESAIQSYKVGLEELQHEKEATIEVASLVGLIETLRVFDKASPRPGGDLNVLAELCVTEENIDQGPDDVGSDQPAVQHELLQGIEETSESEEDIIRREIAIIEALITNKKEDEAFDRYKALIDRYGYRNGALRIKEVATRLGDQFFDEHRRDRVEEVAKLLLTRDKNNLVALGFRRRIKLGEGAVPEFQTTEVNMRQNWQEEVVFAKKNHFKNSNE